MSESSLLTPASAIVTVAGYVSSKARWRDFDVQWPRALHAEALTCFNAQDFAQGRGEFSDGWVNDEPRRRRLVEALSRVVEHHMIRAFSCSVHVNDYEAISREYRLAEGAGGPYAVCAARVIDRVQRWMGVHRPDDLTLCVFEDGDIGHHDIRRLLSADGIRPGEPVQVWPRQWIDERGRRRYLRPFEACDLLTPESTSDLADRLSRRDACEHEWLDRDHLRRICSALACAPCQATRVSNAASTY